MAGRPGKFEQWINDDGLTAIEGWCREGANDEDLARKMGINVGTLYEWKRRFPQIVEAIKKGKAPVDFKVENQLLKSALGYYVKVQEPIKVKTKNQLAGKGTIEEEHIEMVEKEVYIPPNVTAQFFWLKNRRPDKWRDKHEVAAVQVGQLAELIDGLKEPCDNDLYKETAGADGAMEDEPTETP